MISMRYPPVSIVFLLFTILYHRSLAFSADDCRNCVASGKVYCRIVVTKHDNSATWYTDNNSTCLLSSQCSGGGTQTNTMALTNKADCVENVFSDDFSDELVDVSSSYYVAVGAAVLAFSVVAVGFTVVGIATCVYGCCTSERRNRNPLVADAALAIPLMAPETSARRSPRRRHGSAGRPRRPIDTTGTPPRRL